MPPKAQPVGKKAEQKRKEKIIEDKTFGIKNKKGAQNQKYVQQIQNQVGLLELSAADFVITIVLDSKQQPESCGGKEEEGGRRLEGSYEASEACGAESTARFGLCHVLLYLRVSSYILVRSKHM